jgi:hypothetical protein
MSWTAGEGAQWNMAQYTVRLFKRLPSQSAGGLSPLKRPRRVSMAHVPGYLYGPGNLGGLTEPRHTLDLDDTAGQSVEVRVGI